MGPVAILFGSALIGVGLVGYFGTGTASVTALIPAFLGLPLVLLGLLALKDSFRKHAMHLAAVIGLLGFLGAGYMARPKLHALFANEPILRPDGKDARVAVLSQAVTAVLCGVFLALCVHSFIQARRRRKAAEAGPATPM